MKVLTISTIYPTRPRPHYGVFVKNRMVEVAKLVEDLIVVSPQPYFPLVHRLVARYRHRPHVPKEDVIEGVRVLYPRFFSIPRYLKPLDPLSIALSLVITILQHPELRKSDVFDIHCAYPDGLGGVLAARLFRKPTTITLRGHDVNDVPAAYPLRRLEVKVALAWVDQVFSVARALVDAATDLGTPEEKCTVLPNGVDASLFRPLVQTACRRKTGLPLQGRMVLSVGYLVKRKGYHLVVEALGRLRRQGMHDLFAAFVGDAGDEPGVLNEMRKLIAQYDLEEHVFMPGRVSQEELIYWYNAADIFCLASDKEGWANVLLESLACGTPVVATNVWGTPEVIRTPDVGILVERSVPAIEAGLKEGLSRLWDEAAIVRFAQEHTWQRTAKQVVEKLEALLAAST